MNAYTVAGDARNPRRAALIHSLAMDREFWRPVAERVDAAVLVLKRARHLPPLERPDEVAARLRELLHPVAVA